MCFEMCFKYFVYLYQERANSLLLWKIMAEDTSPKTRFYEKLLALINKKHPNNVCLGQIYFTCKKKLPPPSSLFSHAPCHFLMGLALNLL